MSPPTPPARGLAWVGRALLAATLLGLTGVAPAAGAKQADERSFGLVIGTNRSHDPKVKPLRFADDDAVQNAKLLSELGAQVVLLAELDPRSRRLYPDLKAAPPTLAAVRQALARLNTLMEATRRSGREPVLYVFYSGHGDVKNNEGYVNLQDGRLWRHQFVDLLRRSKATRNHVVIDACKSYFMVFARGRGNHRGGDDHRGGARSPIVGPLIDNPKQIPSNTGVFLSTSAAVDSHEWEAFEGGVFSHELRSALRGAADHDLDGRVTYEEAGAFVWSANRAVPNARFRPSVFARPPGGAKAADALLMQVSRASGHRLRITGRKTSGHLYVEDGRGVRLVDFRPSARQRLLLLLPPRRPLFVRSADASKLFEVELPPGPTIALASLTPRKPTVARRGAEHVAFERLFAHPFDASSIVAYRKRPRQVTKRGAAPPPDRTWLRRGLGISAAALAVAGGAMTLLAVADNQSVGPGTDGVDRRRINDRIDGFNIAAVTLYALAGTALAAYLTWTLWPEKRVNIEVMPTPQPRVRLSVGF